MANKVPACKQCNDVKDLLHVSKNGHYQGYWCGVCKQTVDVNFILSAIYTDELCND